MKRLKVSTQSREMNTHCIDTKGYKRRAPRLCALYCMSYAVQQYIISE